jgi:hypothetical protein
MAPPAIITLCNECAGKLPACTCGQFRWEAFVALADVSHEEQERWKAENLDLNVDPPEVREGAGVSDPPPVPPLPAAGPEVAPTTDVEGNALPDDLVAALERGEFPEPPPDPTPPYDDV